jgi:hypothetical protein
LLLVKSRFAWGFVLRDAPTSCLQSTHIGFVFVCVAMLDWVGFVEFSFLFRGKCMGPEKAVADLGVGVAAMGAGDIFTLLRPWHL